MTKIFTLFKSSFSLCLLLSTFPSWSFAQKVIIVRHGEAQQNVMNVFSSDVEKSLKYPLTEKGKNQVTQSSEELKEKLHFGNETIGTVYVSPLRRTRETADILVKTLKIDRKKVHPEKLLVESNMGSWDGKSAEEYVRTYKVDSWDHSIAHQYAGETDEDVTERLKKFVDELKKKKLKKDILVVTHGTPAELLYTLLSGKKSEAHFKNAEFRVLELNEK